MTAMCPQSNFKSTFNRLMHILAISIVHSVLKVKVIWHFQPGEGPGRGLLRDCKTPNFAKVRSQLRLPVAHAHTGAPLGLGVVELVAEELHVVHAGRRLGVLGGTLASQLPSRRNVH